MNARDPFSTADRPDSRPLADLFAAPADEAGEADAAPAAGLGALFAAPAPAPGQAPAPPPASAPAGAAPAPEAQQGGTPAAPSGSAPADGEELIQARARKRPMPAALAAAMAGAEPEAPGPSVPPAAPSAPRPVVRVTATPANDPAPVVRNAARPSPKPEAAAPTPAAPAQQPQAAPAPAVVAPRPPGSRPLITPAATSPVLSAVEPTAQPAPAIPSAPPAAEAAPAVPPEAQTGPEPAAAPVPSPERTMTMPQPIAPTVKEPTAEDLARTAEYARRAKEIERSWPAIDRILSVLRSDVRFQTLIDRFEFTSDLAKDQQQRTEFIAAMRPQLGPLGVNISSPSDVDLFLSGAYDEITTISVLGDLWRDPEITEIMVDRWDVITVERNGRLERTGYQFRDQNHANSVARKLAQKISDRAVSQAIPLVTAELPRARITIAFGAVVKGGLSITIRKFRDLLGLEDLLAFGALNDEMVAFLTDAVASRTSILVSGGTGTGKTTMINLLSSFIPDTERVVTIEDAFELQLANTHVVSLQTKEPSSRDDTVHISLADLLRNTLRMRPDRIIVGEIREPEGAEVMLAAANTGHEGTVTTIHANSADDALNERLTDLMSQARKSTAGAVRRSIASAFDLVIQVTRGRFGRRYISEIANVTNVDADGVIQVEPIFTGDEEGGSVRFTRVPVRADTALGRRFLERGGGQWVA